MVGLVQGAAHLQFPPEFGVHALAADIDVAGGGQAQVEVHLEGYGGRGILLRGQGAGLARHALFAHRQGGDARRQTIGQADVDTVEVDLARQGRPGGRALEAEIGVALEAQPIEADGLGVAGNEAQVQGQARGEQADVAGQG